MIKKWLLTNVTPSNKNSIAYKCRKKRMDIFEKFYKEKISDNGMQEKKILDVGGDLNFWKTMEFKYFNEASITLLNIHKLNLPDLYSNVSSVLGDACDLSQYNDKEFDLVFSNSVIEHVGNFERQRKMVEEMKRVGKHCYLQTPNRFFILEPHFLVPFFQFFPVSLKAFLIKNFPIGHFKKAETYAEALEVAESIRLMTKKELKILFPGIKIRREKIGVMTKSFYLYF